MCNANLTSYCRHWSISFAIRFLVSSHKHPHMLIICRSHWKTIVCPFNKKNFHTRLKSLNRKILRVLDNIFYQLSVLLLKHRNAFSWSFNFAEEVCMVTDHQHIFLMNYLTNLDHDEDWCLCPWKCDVMKIHVRSSSLVKHSAGHMAICIEPRWMPELDAFQR